MSRRFLLNDELLEVEDSVEDISGAGNFMDCGDLLVEQVSSLHPFDMLFDTCCCLHTSYTPAQPIVLSCPIID